MNRRCTQFFEQQYFTRKSELDGVMICTMKSTIAVAATVVVLTLPATRLLAQQTPVEYSYELRVQLAKRLLEPMRQKLIKDPESQERQSNFTGQMAPLDPNWTMKFILDNPLPKDGPLFDHNAKIALASRARELDEQDLIRMIESSRYMRHHYVLSALRSLPDEKEELRSRLVELAMAEEAFNFQAVSSLIQIAKLSGDPKVKEALQSRTDQYYQSGEATKALNELKKEMEKTGELASVKHALLIRSACRVRTCGTTQTISARSPSISMGCSVDGGFIGRIFTGRAKG